jgi:hypothetical protein
MLTATIRAKKREFISKIVVLVVIEQSSERPIFHHKRHDLTEIYVAN